MKGYWYSKYGQFKKYSVIESCAHAYKLLDKKNKGLEKIEWWQFRKRFIMEKEIKWLSKRIQGVKMSSF